MAPIDFTVSHQFAARQKAVWEEMTDWPSHGRWIPATRIEVDSEEHPVGGRHHHHGVPGWAAGLVDRMRISAIDWDPAARRGLLRGGEARAGPRCGRFRGGCGR
ncbi:MAG: hypothetical protein R2705_25400 [Ilumatobacteraceae bacterium]